MAIVAHIMGATCSGKSTFLEWAAKQSDEVGLVEVGKFMRAKYGAAHFKGQAAPAHTQEEAWNVCEEQAAKHIQEGRAVVLVDGQPRSLDQVEKCCDTWHKYASTTRFILFHCDYEERERRLMNRFERPDDPEMLKEWQDSVKLGKQRLVNDERTYHMVMAELLKRGQRIHVCDTTRWGTDVPIDEARADVLYCIRHSLSFPEALRMGVQGQRVRRIGV
jgi:predicted kinase